MFSEIHIGDRNVKVSFILATISDKASIDDLLRSIAGQKRIPRVNCEVIVVDQSFGAEIFARVMEWSSTLDIVYVHSLVPGLSVSRNIGIDLAKGDVFCFADDDCTYEIDTLERLEQLFRATEYDFTGISVRDPQSNALTSYTRNSSAGQIEMSSIEGNVTSISVIVRRTSRTSKIRFDERFGLGAKFGSCEDLLYVRDLIRSGATGIFQPDITVFHQQANGYSKDKTEMYASGHGALTRILIDSNMLSERLWGVRRILRMIARFPMQMFVSRKLFPVRYSKGFVFGFSRVVVSSRQMVEEQR